MINEKRTNWKKEKEGLFEASILAFDEPSRYGIDNGRISLNYIL